MTSPKVLSRRQLLESAAAQRAGGRTIVFANGAFDLLHVGHVRYLEAARREGGWLAVGINSDDSVSRAKGSGRPVVPEAERMEIVAALSCVDAVVLFEEDSPAGLLQELRPEVHAKGTDYTEGSVPERNVVAGYGGRTAIVGDPKDHATTDVIERVRLAALRSPLPARIRTGERAADGRRLMRLLIVRLSAMGDIVHALPLAENAHRCGAKVAWLTEPGHRDLLEGNPNVDRLFFADTRSWRRRPFSTDTRRSMSELSAALAGFRADAAVDVQGLWKSALLSRAARAPVVGFAASQRKEPASALLCQRWVHPAAAAGPHVVDQNLALLDALGIRVLSRAPDAGYLAGRPSREAQEFLASMPRPFVLHHPGAGRPEKVWGEARLARVARLLLEWRGLHAAISWGPGDEARARRMEELVPGSLRVPRLDVHGLAHVALASALFVAGDTGPLHLADALGVPTLALFGPTDPARNGPYRGTAVRYDPSTREEEVAARALEILDRRAAPTGG